MIRSGAGKVATALERALGRIIEAKPKHQRQAACDLVALQTATGTSTVRGALSKLLRDRETTYQRLAASHGPIAAGNMLARLDRLTR